MKRKMTFALMLALVAPFIASCAALEDASTNTHYAAYIVRETLVKTPTIDSFVGTIGDGKIEETDNPNFAVMEQRLEKLSRNENLPKAKLTIKKGGSFVFREDEPDSNETLYDSEQQYATEFWKNQENFELPKMYQID